MGTAPHSREVTVSAPADEVTHLRRIILIDDDDLSREVLTLIAGEAGCEVESFASGEEALAALAGLPKPAAILADMQMPGISGAALAAQLRERCDDPTILLAMSGSDVAAEKLEGYDGFLLKPFSADELRIALDQRALQAKADSGASGVLLNEAVFDHFARSMPASQLFRLYDLCLEDSGKRVTAMRKALETGDGEAYRRAAHAIKGGCGMVGAVELATLAAIMEKTGLPTEPDAAPLDLFMAASERLRRMLDNKARGIQADATAVRP
jgi:CheY-like chemotaxis protein/HPt (histidine-containing phosphotransfer) domain-containing protein